MLRRNDGSYWHRNKVEKDNEKNEALNSLGYEVLHVREFGLPKLNSFDGEVIELRKYVECVCVLARG